MNTASMPPAQQGGGCGPLVVFMISTLTFVLGLLIGGGGLFAYLKADPTNVSALGLAAPSTTPVTAPTEDTSTPPVVVEKECPPCEQATAPAGGGATYALVYPIEETLRVEGEMNKEALREYVIKHRFELQKCYQDVLDKDPSIKGEATMQFTISKAGKIIAAVTRQDTVNNEALKKCLVEKVKTWDLKEAKIKSNLVVVKFDILFTPIGAGGP